MASYNCSDSQNQAYGAGSYSTCDAASGTGVIGAPHTGFMQVVSDGGLMIILPLAAAIIFAVAATFANKKKKSKANQ